MPEHIEIEFVTSDMNIDRKPRTTVVSGYFEDHRVDPRAQLEANRPAEVSAIIEQLDDEFTGDHNLKLPIISTLLDDKLTTHALNTLDELVNMRGLRHLDTDGSPAEQLRQQLALILGDDDSEIHTHHHHANDTLLHVEHASFHDEDTRERLAAALRLLGWYAVREFSAYGDDPTGFTIARRRPAV